MANNSRPNRVLAFGLQVAHPGSSPATIRHASSGPLPANSIIRRINIRCTGETTLGTNGHLDFQILPAGPNPPANTDPAGTSIFGTINPGGTTATFFTGGDTALPIVAAAGTVDIFYPDYYIQDTGQMLTMTVRKSAVSVFNIGALIFVEVLDAPLGPDQPIIPRGTEEEPVCVRICGQPPPPPTPDPGPQPPPPPPPPPPPALRDVLEEPLPPGSSIDVLFPIESAGRVCDAP